MSISAKPLTPALVKGRHTPNRLEQRLCPPIMSFSRRRSALRDPQLAHMNERLKLGRRKMGLNDHKWVNTEICLVLMYVRFPLSLRTSKTRCPSVRWKCTMRRAAVSGRTM